MQDSNSPTKIPLIWASSAGPSYIRPIPTASQIGIQNGAASFTDGFPPLTFQPVAAGGVPPFGSDFQGIISQITAGLQWLQAGGPYVYDSVFQTAIGGYPKGAIVPSAAYPGVLWYSQADNNTTDPDTGGSNWVAFPLLHGRQIWASAGSYNWTCPAGVTRVRATALGAGGGAGGSSGSGSAGSAGGSGEYRTGIFTVVPGTVYAVTIGAGGPVSSGNGTAGGAVSFASFMTAMGGGGGYEGIGGIEDSVSGAGGTGGSGGDFSWDGALGGYGYLIGSGGIAAAIGVGAYGFTNNSPETGASIAAGAAAEWPGSSGNGGIFGGAGGAGADGMLILKW